MLDYKYEYLSCDASCFYSHSRTNYLLAFYYVLMFIYYDDAVFGLMLSLQHSLAFLITHSLYTIINQSLFYAFSKFTPSIFSRYYSVDLAGLSAPLMTYSIAQLYNYPAELISSPLPFFTMKSNWFLKAFSIFYIVTHPLYF